MNRYTIVLLASSSLLLMTACATQHSPLHDETEGAYLFVTDDETAIFDVAYDAMATAESGLAVTPVSGPVRGFTMRKQWLLDYWVSTLLVHRAIGVTGTGEVITGYYPEVTGDGTLVIRGPKMDKRIYEAAVRGFERVGTRRSVMQLDSEIYLSKSSNESEIATSRREQSDDSKDREQAPISRSTEQRLVELDLLFEKDLISEAEYQKAREAILEDL